MSFSADKQKAHRRALRAFAESEAKSDSEDDDLDIIRSRRKELDLSQYIEGCLLSHLTSNSELLIYHSSDSDTNSVPR